LDGGLIQFGKIQRKERGAYVVQPL
jgi:hypothetical protein